MITRKQIAVSLAAAVLLAGIGALAATVLIRAMELPPSDGQALAAIVQSVERKRPGDIKSIEYEPDWWKLTPPAQRRPGRPIRSPDQSGLLSI